MYKREVIDVERLAPPVGPYSHAVKVSGGGLLFISGCAAFDASGKVVGQGDIVQQSRQVYENLRAVLEAAGASWQNVIKITNYMVHASDYPKMAEVRKEYMRPPYPASTLVEVRRLLDEDMLIEVEAIASLSE